MNLLVRVMKLAKPFCLQFLQTCRGCPGIVMKCGCDVHNVTTAIILKIVLRLLPTFAGVLREKIRTRASFTKIQGNCILDNNVNNCTFDKNLI